MVKSPCFNHNIYVLIINHDITIMSLLLIIYIYICPYCSLVKSPKIFHPLLTNKSRWIRRSRMAAALWQRRHVAHGKPWAPEVTLWSFHRCFFMCFPMENGTFQHLVRFLFFSENGPFSSMIEWFSYWIIECWWCSIALDMLKLPEVDISKIPWDLNMRCQHEGYFGAIECNW